MKTQPVRVFAIAAPRRASFSFFAFLAVVSILLSASLTARAQTPDAQYELATGLYSQRLYSASSEKLRAFIQANPTHPKAAFAAYQLGAALYRLPNEKGVPDYAAVAAAYEKALLKPAPTPQIAAAARFELGDADFNLKRYDAAIKVLGEYLGSTPAPDKANAAWAQYWIAQSYDALKKPVEARAAYAKVVASYGENADVAPYAQNTLGILAAEAGDNKTAVAAFSSLLKKFPQSDIAPEARLRLGDAYLAAKNFADAQATYKAVIADPKAAEFKSDAALGLADAYFADKNFTEAATAYAGVLPLLKEGGKARVAAQLQLAGSYFNAKKYEEAVKAYAPLLQSADADTAAQANYFSAGSLQSLNRPAEAAPLFRKVVESFPKHSLAAKAALRLGDAYADAKDNERAIAAYNAVVLKFPTSPSAKEAKAALADLQGAAEGAQLSQIQVAYDAKNWDKTSALAAALLAKKPNAQTAENALYLWADAKRQNGDAEGAAKVFNQLVTTYPKGEFAGDARLGLAWTLLDTKNWSGAEAGARAGLTAIAKDAKAGELRDRLNLALGEALIGGKKPADAALVFARVESSTNKEFSSQAIYGAALALEQSKQWLPAAAKWGKYADASSDAATKSKAYLRQGLDFSDAKKPGEALIAFDKAIAADPKSEVASQALYESAWQARDLKKSADEKARWARLASEFPAGKFAGEAHFQQGEVLYEAKSYEEAAASYRLVSDQSELAPNAWYRLGSALYETKNWSEAAAAFDKAAGAKKDFSVEASFWAGESWRLAGKTVESKTRYEAFLKSIAALPTAAASTKALQLYTPRARLGLGLSLAAAKNWTQAATMYQAALPNARGATAAELNFRLGEALMQQSKWKEAASSFLTVSTLFPASEWAGEAQWNAGQTLEKSGDKAGAIEIYKSLAARVPESDSTRKAQAQLKALNAN